MATTSCLTEYAASPIKEDGSTPFSSEREQVLRHSHAFLKRGPFLTSHNYNMHLSRVKGTVFRVRERAPVSSRKDETRALCHCETWDHFNVVRREQLQMTLSQVFTGRASKKFIFLRYQNLPDVPTYVSNVCPERQL